jgi:hypothetical protein
MKAISLILFLILSWELRAQSSEQILNELEDDTILGGDIFSDFNEDIESGQTLEDERYYRYGRFFSVNMGLGLTSFTGNRGAAYDDNPPTFHFSVNYFLDFQKAVTLGVEYSKHTMILDTIVNGYRDMDQLGAVVTDMTRVFVGFKYYIDTTDLGTAITYSNPHYIARAEYWYQTNDFIDHRSLPRQKGGGIGTGLGFGLEFPVELKESYVSVEFLYHVVNFFDKFTQDYRMVFDPDTGLPVDGSTYGYDDLVGNVLTFMITYNITW